MEEDVEENQKIEEILEQLEKETIEEKKQKLNETLKKYQLNS